MLIAFFVFYGTIAAIMLGVLIPIATCDFIDDGERRLVSPRWVIPSVIFWPAFFAVMLRRVYAESR